jgi:hypothetical protein
MKIVVKVEGKGNEILASNFIQEYWLYKSKIQFHRYDLKLQIYTTFPPHELQIILLNSIL